MLEKIRDEEFDGIIMAYSCFEQIPLSQDFYIDELRDMKEKVNDLLNDSKKVTKSLRKKNEKLGKQLAVLATTLDNIDCGVFFDDLGISRLYIDEAHNYKNVPIETKADNVLGITRSGSKKCKDMLDKVRVVQKSGGGVVMATGTPITNSITDAFIMQKYLQNGELGLLDLQNFDSWIGMFAEKSTEFEIDVDTSSYRLATRFSKFHNLPELTTLFSQIADFHHMDEVNGIPAFDGYSDALIGKTLSFENYLDLISSRADVVRAGFVNRSVDNMLKITTDGRKAALDIRLVDSNEPFTQQSKVYRCAENVFDIYLKTDGTQLVFCDTSTPKSSFNMYDELKRLLIEKGILPSQIAFVHDATTEAKRNTLFKMMRNGDIRVLIGSTFKLGIGVNVQDRTRLNETREGLSRSLISALYDNGRIFNKRYTYVDFYENDSFNDSALEALYRSCGGGAIIIRYHSDDESNDRFARNNRNSIERICETAKTFCQSVLTVFWTNLDSVKTRDSFLANLTSVPIVEITEDMANAERAEIYLSERAKDNKIDADDKLFNNIKDGKSFHITELNRWFDEWYTEKLHTVVYAQYKDVKTVKSEIVKAAPKGNAAVELHEMIGLDNAKEVIENAVSFFKMQKLYAEKGIKADRPSMHMVFTGNPGTAKTTVARLFAQIMKDNGLLTKGDLYEVGRADIVGQFVGQTAPLVKKHFNMAKGSVLFIDEAYSLVDDRNGLYGDEAINTIVQEMENNRSDLVVIFAGYPDKMEEFLNKNPGLRSRIAFHVNFDDYSTDELIDIADLMIKKTGFKFTGEAHKKLGEVFDAARKKQDFGNGRYVRNLIELSSLKQASRLAKSDIDHLTDDEMRTITVADIAAPLLSRDDGKMAAIGF